MATINSKPVKSTWNKDELRYVLDLYILIKGKGIHKNNPNIIDLSNSLGKKVRSVEAQLLMFRNLERGGNYSRKNMSHICRELWEERQTDLRGTIWEKETQSHKELQISLPKSDVRTEWNEQGSKGGTMPTVKPAGQACGNNKIIEAILRRAHGGIDAAVVPGSRTPDGLPEAPPPAGVEDAIERLFARISGAPDGQPADWLFLVGGPGNGKSHQLDGLLTRLQAKGLYEKGGHVKHADRYQASLKVNGQSVKIINDATIRPPRGNGKNGPGHLAMDCSNAYKEKGSLPSHLFVNVNRGVLIEEYASVRGRYDWAAEAELLRWLLFPLKTERSDYLTPSPNPSAYYGGALFQKGEGAASVRVHAVSMDQLSLLEMSPGNKGKSIANIGTATPEAAPYLVMPLDAPDRVNTPVGQLIMRVLDAKNFNDGACKECVANGVCPFLANVTTLQQANGMQGFLKLLRGAEIATARLFTYRDAWSLIATAIVGSIRPEFIQGDPCNWVRENADIATRASNKKESMRSLTKLVLHRVHNSIFPGRLPTLFCGMRSSSIKAPPPVPSVSSLALVDPARDVSADWAEDVNEAMEALAFGDSPIGRLRAQNPAFNSCATRLDMIFEEKLLEWFRQEKKIKQQALREHIRWLGTSYYRLYSLAIGRPGQREILDEWVKIRRGADNGRSAPVDSRLHRGLQNLILPEPRGTGIGSEYALLPIFWSRVEPIQSKQEFNILCAAIQRSGPEAIQLEYRANGDSLWVYLSEGGKGKEIARLPMDYWNCREALVAYHGQGFTEAGATSIPRVERLRASLVSTRNRSRQLVMVGNSSEIVEF